MEDACAGAGSATGKCSLAPGAPAGTAFRPSMDMPAIASCIRPTGMWGVFADVWNIRGPTHRDVGSVRGCLEHPRTDPQGCGECLLAPGAPAGTAFGPSMAVPEFAPAIRPTGMWGVFADVWNIRGPTHRDVGSACWRRERSAGTAFRPSMDMPEFAPAILPTWMWEVSPGAGSAGGPGIRAIHGLAGICSCNSGVPSIHGHQKKGLPGGRP